MVFGSLKQAISNNYRRKLVSKWRKYFSCYFMPPGTDQFFLVNLPPETGNENACSATTRLKTLSHSNSLTGSSHFLPQEKREHRGNEVVIILIYALFLVYDDQRLRGHSDFIISYYEKSLSKNQKLKGKKKKLVSHVI